MSTTNTAQSLAPLMKQVYSGDKKSDKCGCPSSFSKIKKKLKRK